MQKYLLMLLGIGLLFGIGCDLDNDDDNTTNPGDPSPWKVQILSPQPNSILEMRCEWEQLSTNPNYCQWGFRIDTIFAAEILATVPGGVHNAQVYIQQYPYDPFQTYQGLVNPGGNQFLAPFYQLNTNTNYVPPDTLRGAFFVQVTAGDGSNWVSPAMSYRIVPRAYPQLAEPPVAPAADTLYEYDNDYSYNQGLAFYWCNLAPNVENYVLLYRSDFDNILETDTLPRYYNFFNIYDYLPLTTYTVQIKALNSFGESAPSTALQVETALPNVPETEVQIANGVDVEVDWYLTRMCDTLQLARKEVSGAWETLISMPMDNYYPSWYLDTTTVAHTTYYYRLGMTFANGTWWSTDSSGVSIP